MSDIVRRDNQKPVPVKARRVSTPAGDPPSATVRVPPVATESAPQTVVYVTLPAGPPQPPAAEVHYHTTVTNHHYAATRRRRQRTTSFLATFAFVVGLAACAAAFVPQLLAVARYGSIGAAALAAVALLGAVAVRRTGTGMPLLAVIVAGLGYGLWLKNAGQLPAAWRQVQAASPVAVPALPPSVTAPMQPSEPPPASPPQSPPAQSLEPAKPKRHNLFDMRDVTPTPADLGQMPATPPGRRSRHGRPGRPGRDLGAGPHGGRRPAQRRLRFGRDVRHLGRRRLRDGPDDLPVGRARAGRRQPAVDRRLRPAQRRLGPAPGRPGRRRRRAGRPVRRSMTDCRGRSSFRRCVRPNLSPPVRFATRPIYWSMALGLMTRLAATRSGAWSPTQRAPLRVAARAVSSDP